MPASKEYIGICIDRSEAIPRVTGVKDGHRMGREALIQLTEDIKFAMMLLVYETEEESHEAADHNRH